MVIWDMRPLNLNSVFFEKACNFASITLNPVRIAGAADPNAVRVGSMASTTRGYTAQNMTDVGVYLHQIMERTLHLKAKSNNQLGDFIVKVQNDSEMKKLKAEIESYADNFPVPGL